MVSSYWLYTVKILHGRKQEFIDYMKERGVMVSQVHKRNDRHSCVSQFAPDMSLGNLDVIENEIVCIPVGWWVTHEQRSYIVGCMKEF